MFIRRHKSLFWVIVVWFALLQSILPFIHAHVSTGAVCGTSGIHIHDEGFGKLENKLADATGVKAMAADLQVVGVDKGITNNQELQLLPCLILLALIFPYFAKQSQYFRPTQLFNLSPIRRRTRLNPRAPPYC